MSTSTWSSVLPFEFDVMRKHCIAAMHSGGFSRIDVANAPGGGSLLTASRRVAGQWTRTSITVTIAPHGTSSAVGAYSSATPQSLISLFRSPSRVVILKFIDNLFAITATPRKRWVSGSSNVGGIALGIALSSVLLLTVVGAVFVSSSSFSDEAAPQSAIKPAARNTQTPSSSLPTSSPTVTSEREPSATVAVQAITQLAATVRLKSRADSEQIVEVSVDFIAGEQTLATGSSIVRLKPREEAYVDVQPEELVVVDSPFQAVIRTVEVLP